MRKKSSYWLKNVLILLLLVLLAGGCYLFYIGKTYQTDFQGAVRIFWDNRGSILKLGEPEPERVSTEVDQIYVTQLAQGNYFAGEDFPAGVYELDAGNGEFLFRVCQDGKLLGEGMISSKEGSSYQERQTGISLQAGQILILMGNGTAILQSEENLEYIYYPAGTERKIEQELALGAGSYTVGEELPAGECYLYFASEDVTSIATSRPYEGGVELIRDPEKGDRSEIYRNVRLQEGDTVTIQGGEVRFTYIVDVE